MVRQVPAFIADDDSVWLAPADAAKVNVELLVKRAPVEMTEATRKQLAQWFVQDAEKIIDVLGAYREFCPNEPREEAPSESSEGPVVMETANGD